MSLTDAVAKQIAITLDLLTKENQDYAAKIQQLEAAGYRIINGGSIGEDSWEYTDYKTGEVLAKGSHAEYDAYDPPMHWYHRDHICEDTLMERELVEGIPESLADCIIEWVQENEDEARAWLAVIRSGEDNG